MKQFNLITDRTANDVHRWRELHDKGWQAMTEDERHEWMQGHKGSYNCIDMNRVESAVEYVAARLTAAGYPVSVEVKTNWSITSEPTVEDLERYFGNVAKLREVLVVPASTPYAPTVKEKLTHEGANHLEQILLDVGNLVQRMFQTWFYSSDLFAGEV